ncbi:hypothetical protein SK128_027185 [Halocaridina rubra]|uniref:Uncharacterized protein n=1 Tax=Halocaridina rubra TaxID=373956 RepID=A0AAN9AFF2_HALRR
MTHWSSSTFGSGSLARFSSLSRYVDSRQEYYATSNDLLSSYREKFQGSSRSTTKDSGIANEDGKVKLWVYRVVHLNDLTLASFIRRQGIEVLDVQQISHKEAAYKSFLVTVYAKDAPVLLHKTFWPGLVSCTYWQDQPSASRGGTLSRRSSAKETGREIQEKGSTFPKLFVRTEPEPSSSNKQSAEVIKERLHSTKSDHDKGNQRQSIRSAQYGRGATTRVISSKVNRKSSKRRKDNTGKQTKMNNTNTSLKSIRNASVLPKKKKTRKKKKKKPKEKLHAEDIGLENMKVKYRKVRHKDETLANKFSKNSSDDDGMKDDKVNNNTINVKGRDKAMLKSNKTKSAKSSNSDSSKKLQKNKKRKDSHKNTKATMANGGNQKTESKSKDKKQTSSPKTKLLDKDKLAKSKDIKTEDRRETLSEKLNSKVSVQERDKPYKNSEQSISEKNNPPSNAKDKNDHDSKKNMKSDPSARTTASDQAMGSKNRLKDTDDNQSRTRGKVTALRRNRYVLPEIPIKTPAIVVDGKSSSTLPIPLDNEGKSEHRTETQEYHTRKNSNWVMSLSGLLIMAPEDAVTKLLGPDFDAMLIQDVVSDDELFLGIKVLAHASRAKTSPALLQRLVNKIWQPHVVNLIKTFTVTVERLYPDRAERYFWDLAEFMDLYVSDNMHIKHVSSLINTCAMETQALRYKSYVSDDIMKVFKVMQSKVGNSDD